jgi:hypothetical protein
MTAAPSGAEVGIFVDVIAPVAIGDVIETQTGRRYGVVAVRVQQRREHVGRQHLRCVVLGAGAEAGGEVHRIRWYRRKRGKR